MTTIAFDVDGTLVSYQDEPRWEVLAMLRLLSKTNTIIVWSGGGKDYAEMWVRKLGIEKYVNGCRHKPMGTEKAVDVDVCFDDENVDIAKVNIRI